VQKAAAHKIRDMGESCQQPPASRPQGLELPGTRAGGSCQAGGGGQEWDARSSVVLSTLAREFSQAGKRGWAHRP